MRPISEHLGRFLGTGVTVFALTLEVGLFLEGTIATSTEFARVISTVIHRHFKKRVVTLPASDGFIFLVDGNPGPDRPEPEPYRVSNAVAEIEAKLKELAPATRPPKYDIHVVDENGAPAIAHDAFIALKMDQRYSHILAMLNHLKKPPLIFLRGLAKTEGDTTPIYAQHEPVPVLGEPAEMAHGDARYEISPAALATDIQIMRAVCRRMSSMFDAGEVLPQYCPLNFNTIKDQRYWPIYEIEIRNVPSFFMPFIRWELVDIQPGASPETIGAVVDRLRPFSANISICQVGREALERTLLESPALRVSELSFYVPSGLHDHDWAKMVDSVGTYAAHVAQRGEMIGLRNVPIGTQLPLQLLSGGIFLSPDASRRMNLVASATAVLS